MNGGKWLALWSSQQRAHRRMLGVLQFRVWDGTGTTSMSDTILTPGVGEAVLEVVSPDGARLL
jgi:hypothetical protein